jgi:hypothetical protein
MEWGHCNQPLLLHLVPKKITSSWIVTRTAARTGHTATSVPFQTGVVSVFKNLGPRVEHQPAESGPLQCPAHGIQASSWARLAATLLPPALLH